MYATDFLFDGQRASDLGLMICSFNGDFETATGGEIEYNVVKTPNRDNFTFYGSQLNSVITWNFSICKNPCKNDNMYFDQYEESMIAKWLVKTDGYRWIQFEQEGYEDIFYNVCISMTPHQVAGRTVGFDLVATSDCAYGFTDVIKKEQIRMDSNTCFQFNVHSDINTYILPIIKIYRDSGMIGDFELNNQNDTMIFKDIKENLTINCDIETVEDLTKPDDFNWCFLKLTDGMNVITTKSDVGFGIEIFYREPRYVRV